MGEKVKVSLDMDTLTFEELEEFEDRTGMVMSDAIRTVIVRDKDNRPIPDPDDPKGRPLKEVKMSARAMRCLVYLTMKRENPELQYADTLKMTMNDVDFDVMERDDSGNSPEPASEQSGHDAQQ